jgi:ATP-dependent Lon protease
MDNKNKMEKKKNKFDKYILFFNKKITSLTNQLDFLFKNKYIVQECYIEKMYLLNEIYIKINNFENININDKKKNKNYINDIINEINKSLEKICNKIGSDSIKNILDIYLYYDEFIENKNSEYINLLDQYNEYFIPLSSNKITDVEKFIKNHNIENINIPIVTKLIDYSKSNTLLEKINGASIIFYVDKTKIIYVNGYFKKDSLNICKSLYEFKNKLTLIEEEIENLDIPLDFKEKYLEQLSLRDFIILSQHEISELLKNDYNEFINYKNKSLSQLIKEFVKSGIEKQRKIIILLLISDEESQFTAHIIFDLITDKSFLSESYYLSDLIFNSLHWKIQKIFKITNENFEKNKKKLENISVNDIPYESRILSLKVNDNIKSKAIEKLKEINGSKENSIKAQQWLDGFLKIPFNTLKKEPIINLFKNYQNKIEKYIDVFTIKISEFNFNNLNNTNQIIYNIIIQIIDEFHSNIYKSENSYDNFIKYIKNVKSNICEYINYYNEDKITSIINKHINQNNIDDNHINIETLDSEYIETSQFSKNNIKENDNKLFLLNNIDNNDIIINKFINNNIVPPEDVVNNCVAQLNYFKKIKKEMYDNNIINKNNIEIMVKKLNELECMLNLNLIKNEEEKSEEYNYDDSYNNGFKKYILKNLEEYDEFINEWDNFKMNKKIYMKEVDKILDKCTYGQNEAKDQMKRIIGQWMNGVSKGHCFGLCGPPGVGKTTLCKNGLAKCLFDENGEERPFAFLPLGGATNGSILEGHHYTYLGSTWGKIVDILMEKKCMNPIIYIDELDKISKTEHGKEIISILTHITDQSQNKEFYDRYFASIPIDLSNVLFIFSYNDRDNIDRILRDRIQEITIKPLSLKEKLIISQNYIIPEISNNIGFSISEILFSNEILTKIINEYTHEAGIRKLNEILYDIVRDINLKKIVGDEIIEYPIIINDKYTDNILCNIPKMNIKKIDNIPRIGMVNGLYATTSGLGGLTIIQVMKTISDKKLGLEKLTGNQGDVMKESMNCALTLAWNIIPNSIKKTINDSKEGYGLHIHCPESATPKDGPSAGLAITTAIISRLINIPIRNDVAMTGEVDLLGKAHEIGGLYSKIQGAINAGIKKVLIPKDNEKDLDIIFKKEEEQKTNLKRSNSIKKIDSYLLLENNCYKINSNKRVYQNKLDIYLVNDIFEILEHSLVDNNLEFNKIF